MRSLTLSLFFDQPKDYLTFTLVSANVFGLVLHWFLASEANHIASPLRHLFLKYMYILRFTQVWSIHYQATRLLPPPIMSILQWPATLLHSLAPFPSEPPEIELQSAEDFTESKANNSTTQTLHSPLDSKACEESRCKVANKKKKRSKSASDTTIGLIGSRLLHDNSIW